MQERLQQDIGRLLSGCATSDEVDVDELYDDTVQLVMVAEPGGSVTR